MKNLSTLLKPETVADRWAAIAGITGFAAILLGLVPLFVDVDDARKNNIKFIHTLVVLPRLYHAPVLLVIGISLCVLSVLLLQILKTINTRRRSMPLPSYINFLGVLWERNNHEVKEKPICPKCKVEMGYALSSQPDLIRWQCVRGCDLPLVEWNNHIRRQEVTAAVAEEFNRFERERGRPSLVKPHRTKRPPGV